MLIFFIIGVLFGTHESFKDDIQFRQLWLYPYVKDKRYFNLGLVSQYYDSLPGIIAFIIRPFYDIYHFSATMIFIILILVMPVFCMWWEFTYLNWFIFATLSLGIGIEGVRLALYWQNYKGVKFIKSIKLK